MVELDPSDKIPPLKHTNNWAPGSSSWECAAKNKQQASPKSLKSEGSMMADPQDMFAAWDGAPQDKARKSVKSSKALSFDSRSNLSAHFSSGGSGGDYTHCNYGEEIKSLRSQLKSAQSEIQALRDMHRLEVSGYQD